MELVLELSGLGFLAAWWGLVGLGIMVALGLSRWLRRPTGGSVSPVDDPKQVASAYDLTAVAVPLRSSPGLVALASLLHRGVLVLDRHGRLRAGDEPLPPDADEIETQLAGILRGRTARDAIDAVDEQALPRLHERLRARGLHMVRPVELALRFGLGCTLALVLAVGGLWLLWSPFATLDRSMGSMGVLVLSMALVAWTVGKRVRHWGRVTHRAMVAGARIESAHPLPLSMKGWPDRSVPVIEVELAMGLWGMLLMLQGGFSGLAAALAECPPPEPHDGPVPIVPINAMLIREALAPTPRARLDRVAASSTWVVLAMALATAGASGWMSMSAGPSRTGHRRSPGFVRLAPVRGIGPSGLETELTTMPPAKRGRRPPDCDPEVAAKAKDSVFGILAEHEREHGPVIPRPPAPERGDDREHRARDGQIFAATGRSLYRIELVDDRATVHAIEDLRVKVATFGSERMVTPFVMHTTELQSMTFDASGLLWASGDERLYVCSIDSGICAPRGIVPPGTRAVAFAARDGGEAVLTAILEDGPIVRLQRVGLPSFLDSFSGIEGKVELCTEREPSFEGAPRFVLGPVDAGGGEARVVVERSGERVLASVRDDEALTVESGVSLGRSLEAVALVPVEERTLVFTATGHVLWVEPSGEMVVLANTGRRWRAAARYAAPPKVAEPPVGGQPR